MQSFEMTAMIHNKPKISRLESLPTELTGADLPRVSQYQLLISLFTCRYHLVVGSHEDGSCVESLLQ